jgi:hypothetical protein
MGKGLACTRDICIINVCGEKCDFEIVLSGNWMTAISFLIEAQISAFRRLSLLRVAGCRNGSAPNTYRGSAVTGLWMMTVGERHCL